MDHAMNPYPYCPPPEDMVTQLHSGKQLIYPGPPDKRGNAYCYRAGYPLCDASCACRGLYSLNARECQVEPPCDVCRYFGNWDSQEAGA